MADVLLTALGGALVQTLTPIPAIEASTAAATTRLNALTTELQTDYQRAKASLPYVAVAGILWAWWFYSRRRAGAQSRRHRPRLHRRGRRRHWAANF